MSLPTFQAQNPAISGYSLGWASCTAFAGAMAASYDQQVPKLCTGGQVRTRTGDTIGGLNLAQVDLALNEGWGVDLSTVYRMPWADFTKKIVAGCGAILQGGYAPIADSRFDAGRGFRGNHAVFVAPGFITMDPLADGRASGVYKYHGESYPQSLLESFAGRLDIGDRLLGQGLVYASFTRDNVHTYHITFTGSFFIYRLGPDGKITGRTSKTFAKPTGAPCTAPKLYAWPGHTSRSLVRVTSGLLADQYIGASSPGVSVRMVP